MKTLKTAIVGTAAATAMAVSATPAMAQDHHKSGISAGEVIAGAVVLGGLAAILTSGKKDKYAYNGNRGYRGNYGNKGNYRQFNARAAVNQCISKAENRASRQYGWANVTEIRDVDRTRDGFRVKGRIVVKDQSRGNRGRYSKSRYNRSNVDNGKFTCYTNGYSHVQVDYKNLDGSRRW